MVKSKGSITEEEFRENYLPELQSRFMVEEIHRLVFEISGTQYGTIELYLRGNKCFLYKKSRWVKPGIDWIKKNLKVWKNN